MPGLEFISNHLAYCGHPIALRVAQHQSCTDVQGGERKKEQHYIGPPVSVGVLHTRSGCSPSMPQCLKANA